jgi:hypothetical protein
MSTRTIIRIKDEYNTWNLYGHGDGYPSYMQKLIEKIMNAGKKADIPNVTLEADKFTTFFLGEAYKEGYKSFYMTKRDIQKEIKETDIEYFYLIEVNNGKYNWKAYKVGSNLEYIDGGTI